MKAADFVQESPGRLYPIAVDDWNDLAFIPDPLPPAWNFPPGLWEVVAEARGQLGVLEGIGRTLPNPDLLITPLQNREAIRSSSLEGTFATARQLILFDIDRSERRGEVDHGDQREVHNYRVALRRGLASELPLSLRLIRMLHEDLMDGVRGGDRAPGEFRRTQVYIGVDRRFIPPPPQFVKECLDQFEKQMHHRQSDFPALVWCFLFHYQFETIHPFYDGNGRVGRLLLSMMLQRWCDFSKPWLYMSAFFDENKDEYIQRLYDVSARADWEGWLRFCLRGTVEQAKDTIARCDKLRQLREQYSERAQSTGGSVRLRAIVDGLFATPIVRVSDLARQLDVTYPTAKADLDRLVDAGVLKEMEDISPKTFIAEEVFGIAYDEV